MRAKYVPQIDALRAVAVIAVLLFHLNNRFLPGGYSGVDVFFVVSGYVISRSMVELDATQWWRFVGEFYSRRALRILPALLVCLCVSFTLTTIFIPKAWLSTTIYDTALYSFWGFGNIALLKSGDGYFAPRIEFNAFAHMWSLGVEEQFYLLFPWVFLLWLVVRARGGERRNVGTLVLGALLLVSLLYCAYTTRRNPALAYYGLPARFWELAAGGLLFQFHSAGRRLVRDASGPQSAQLWVSLGLIVLGFVASVQAWFPFPWAFAAVVGTAGVIDVVTAKEIGNDRLVLWLGSPSLIWVGRRSYSLYLWHWPIYALFRWTVGLETAVEMVIALALSFAAASASYRWVETPFRSAPLMRRARQGYLVFAGLACVYVLSRTVKLMEAHRWWLSASVTEGVVVDWYMDDWIRASNGEAPVCSLRSDETPMPEGGSVLILRADRCENGTRSTESDTRLFVAGNSHAVAYKDMLSRLALKEQFRVYLYFRSNCTLFKLTTSFDNESGECQRFLNAVLNDIGKNARSGDIVFLPSLRLPRLSDQWGQMSEAEATQSLFSVSATESRRVAREETLRMLQPYIRSGVRVIFEAPKPLFRAPAFRCSDWFNRRNPVCAPGLSVPQDFMLRYRQPVVDEMTNLARLDDAISVWDPFYVLCPNATCEAVVQGKPLFLDGDHVSTHSNELLYPSFAEFVKKLDRRSVGHAGAGRVTTPTGRARRADPQKGMTAAWRARVVSVLCCPPASTGDR